MNSIKKLVFPSGKYHKNYNQYVGWSFLSNVLISAESAMGVHSMLQAIDTSFEAVRTVNYIGKDIIGQVGGLLYMAKMGVKADKDPRQFLRYSHALQQTALFSVCSTPMVEDYFLPVAGCASIMSNISFTGFGAINAKCIRQLASEDNIGEVYAKISMINTLGSSIGLLMGLGISIALPDNGMKLCTIPFLAAGRIYAYNRAINGLIK